VVIYTSDQQGSEQALEYLHRGKYFGIISLLTGEPHSVSAKALNDCLLLVIDKEKFDFILKHIPPLAIDLSQTLSRRLKNKDIHQKTIFESTVIAVFSSYAQAGKSIYALNLAFSLRKETNKTVIILDICSKENIHCLPRRLDVEEGYPTLDVGTQAPMKDFIVRSRFGVDLLCFNYDPEKDSSAKELINVLTYLVNDYHYLILDLPSLMDEFVFSVLNQADLIHVLSSPEPVDLKRTHSLIERLKQEYAFHESKIKVIINEYKLSKIAHPEQRDILEHEVFATLPKIDFSASSELVLDNPEGEYAKVIRRISRRIGERFVGLALGVGFGYGFCHIGVLKVIEEEKIPIDVISGSSIGAIIAGLWVTGRSAEEIMKVTREFREPKYMWGLADFTFPTLGFIKGNRLHSFLKKYFGNRTFFDIKLPLKVIASDIRRKETRILEKGLLVDAIMASCSMPGVFRPFQLKEEVLFDGGIANPLPTEALFKAGVRKIIAVNVTPLREDMLRQFESMKEQIAHGQETGKKQKRLSLRQYFRERFKTNILDIIFCSIEMMQSELVQKEAELADIVLHPDTRGLHWLELHKSDEFAKRGEEETRRNLEKIWQVINE
jgi:NTE family protein